MKNRSVYILIAFLAIACLSVKPLFATVIPRCGNGVLEMGEACDGPGGMGNSTCESVAAGFSGGTLGCKSDCLGFDVTQCIEGNLVHAHSCSQVDVQQSIDIAESGDTVLIPPGTCEWDQPVGIGKQISNNPKTYDLKNIVIKGAGIDRTTIVDQRSRTPNVYPLSALNINASPLYAVRITSITFDGRGSNRSQGPINVYGLPKSLVRIDHNRFSKLGAGMPSAGIIFSRAYGLVDHNIFEQGRLISVTGVSIHGDWNVKDFDNKSIVDNDGDQFSWDRPLSLGSIDAVYLEDNEFLFPYTAANGSMDAYDGARYVIRHNKISGTWTGHHGFDSAVRSAFSVEIYDNQFLNPTDKAITVAFESRGGTGVLFNNWVEPKGWGYNGFGILRNYRSSDGYPVAYGRAYGDTSGNGVCDGTNAYDGNRPGMEGYPCRDQVGRTSGQSFMPMFAWNNNFKGNVGGHLSPVGYNSPPADSGWIDRISKHIVKNRDFYNEGVSMDEKTGSYTAMYADEDGSPKQWVYKPYPYPHPLVQMDYSRSDAGADGNFESTRPADEPHFVDFVNIFNPSRREKLEIVVNSPKGAHCQLLVKSRNGIEIAELFDDELYAGEQRSIVWDGRDATNKVISAGIYALLLKFDGGTAKKKIIVVK